MVLKMCAIIFLFLFFKTSAAFEGNYLDLKRTGNKNLIFENVHYVGKRETKLSDQEIKEEKMLNSTNFVNFSAEEEKSGGIKDENSFNKGRAHKLLYKRSLLQFFIKSLFIMKTFLTIILPIGVIAAKILSWKAITFSLMSFLLAKILLVKNLLNGTNVFSPNPTNLAPPFIIQSLPNDALWKRQNDLQPTYRWTSS